MKKRDTVRLSLNGKLNILTLSSIFPFTMLIIYLIVSFTKYTNEYDQISRNITTVNSYMNFKEDLDYSMYQIVIAPRRSMEAQDYEKPNELIDNLKNGLLRLSGLTASENGKKKIERVLKNLHILEERIEEIIVDAKDTGHYDENMERLDDNIRMLTRIVHEQIVAYIYEEAQAMDELRRQIYEKIEAAVTISVIAFIIIFVGTWCISHLIAKSITKPIQNLCRMTEMVAKGDFSTRADKISGNEIDTLSESFNSMIEQIGKLVEDVKEEQNNLRVIELKLLQAQINPHFLYNTLDTIIWLAEDNQTEQVVFMVSSPSDFFRTTLSKGKDFITIKEEESHIKSYLEIQQFRYRDIMDYEIVIPEELYQYSILKLTLQPIVENALYHGIKNKRGMGHIKVTGEKQDERICFTVTDNGIGMKEEKLRELNRILFSYSDEGSSASGFGLYNVEQRIRLNYGSYYGMSIKSAYGEGTEVQILIPAEQRFL